MGVVLAEILEQRFTEAIRYVIADVLAFDSMELVI